MPKSSDETAPRKLRANLYTSNAGNDYRPLDQRSSLAESTSSKAKEGAGGKPPSLQKPDGFGKKAPES